MNKTHRQRDGLTLIEVLLVVALMAILAGLTIPNADPGIQEQLRAAANILATDLAYARSLAITYDSPFRVVVDTTDNQYEITHVGSDSTLSDVIHNPFEEDASLAGRYIVSLAELPTMGPRIRVAAVLTVDSDDVPQSTADGVTFEPMGQTGHYPNATRIWLAAGQGTSEQTISIHVNPVTGLASVEPIAEHPLPDADALATLPEETSS